ncbi:hypothetical protein GDO86_007187 [Hymenochirus boettgeri]|uniref:SEFIR domain-containing protein n=1 Tax=Hymenochirus boettgeri TaxID=247094 RepID=A0A8T2J0T8_9PIPI|nr:hypothetical protein GDO86_007187 [Hymenochirus boettgeri]
MRSKTALFCRNQQDCSPCVQVELDLSLAYLPEGMEELDRKDCEDFGNQEEERDEEEEEESSSSMTDTEHQSNGSSICANLYISKSSPVGGSCIMVNVRLPISSVPINQGVDTVVVGTLHFDCFNVKMSEEVVLSSYTLPRYHNVLNLTHIVPGCKYLTEPNKVPPCKVPYLDITHGETNVSVGIRNGLEKDSFFLKIFTNGSTNNNPKILNGDERYVIQHADIVPCTCFDLQYEENILKKSKLTLTIRNVKLLYTLEADCGLMAEVLLCWKDGRRSACHEIPSSRKQIKAKDVQEAMDLYVHHSSLCVQVRYKNTVWHTNCLHTNDSPGSGHSNQILLLVSKYLHGNKSICIVGRNTCFTFNNTTYQELNGEIFERKILQEFMSGQCTKIWRRGTDEEAFVCSLDKYMRKRWNLALILSLTVVFCGLFVLLMKREGVKVCLRKMIADKPLDAIFNNRRVLILYTPENLEYQGLVEVLATSLKGLSLEVVLDQWYRNQMCELGPTIWYHKEKNLIYDKNGIILFLISEGVKQWGIINPQDNSRSDPYSTIGSILHLVYPDFKDGKAIGHYVVASLDIHHKRDIPEIFHSVPILTLPSQLKKLLKAIAGKNKRKLSQRRLNQLCANVQEKLQKFQHGCETPTTLMPDGSLIVEMHPLI